MLAPTILSTEQIEAEVDAAVAERASKMLFNGQILSLLRYIYSTNFVQNKEHSVSLALIADPARGKSQSMEVFADSTSRFKIVNQVTAYSMEKKILPLAREGKILSMAITDLTASLDKATTQKKNLEHLLLALAEEGLVYKQSFVSDVDLKKPLNLQILFGITFDKFYEMVSDWINSGFSRRFLYCSWDYTAEQLESIVNMKIAQTGFRKKPFRVGLFRGTREYLVNIPQEFFAQIRSISNTVVSNTNFTRTKKYQVGGEVREYNKEYKVVEPVSTARDVATLLRAICLCRYYDNNLPLEDITVNETDIDELTRMALWLNLQKRTFD